MKRSSKKRTSHFFVVDDPLLTLPHPQTPSLGEGARRQKTARACRPLSALGLRKRIVASLLQFKQIFATISVEIRLRFVGWKVFATREAERCLPRLHVECTEGRFLDNVATKSAFLPKIDAAFARRMRTMEYSCKRGKKSELRHLFSDLRQTTLRKRLGPPRAQSWRGGERPKGGGGGLERK